MEHPTRKSLIISGIKAIWPILLMICLQFIDIKEQGLLGLLQVLFALSQAFCVFFIIHMRKLIIKANNGDKVAVGDEAITAAEYDRKKLIEQMFQICCGAVVTYATHLSKGYTAPMALQLFMSPFRLLDSNLAKIYIWGMEATGPLQRPWSSPFGSLDAKAKQDSKKNHKKDKKSR
jgi:hypothetical protein